ncbi:glycoside hydrolase family 3 C-terminal domain-containing protein [Neptunicella sp. SCSIO 80796]|uniref:glycoside hydrolase family 3 protein n=1 Tax=Neptunicella plasticusilytica TaxID=3117012 RepID=UPI003A4E62BA
MLVRLRSASLLIICLALTSCQQAVQQQPPSAAVLPFQNSQLSTEQRVDDLVSRLTLDEKVSQMMNEAPAIERLGIPAYNWWSEGLHGVARAGLATVFPQAIGLAAMWDRQQMFDVATAISDEARAKHHDFAAKGKRFIYQGLTIWSPNINLFRDPRWGRGQETYGEDPYLTGELAVPFIRGLQGDDPRYLKTVATVKHFAVHSGPEPERHEFNATTNKKDLYETYLPMFEKGIKQGGAYSLMCAYNRYNGEAACGSKTLLQDILRRDWDFDGFVVSDCGAIADFHAHHKVTQSAPESAALAVKTGTDLNCGKVYSSLKEAVEQGMISEQQIDVSVKRLFTARFKLGMFDSAEQVAYQNIPYSVVDSEPHQQLALQSARKSMVLLKNANQTLPLKKDIGTLAVIGPNADQWLMLLGNYNGVPSHPVTPLQGIRDKVSSNSKVLFAQGSELAEGIPMFYPVPAEVLQQSNGQAGLQADFFNNSDLQGEVLFSRIDANVDANWNDKAPREDMDDDNFGVRWTGDIVVDSDGEYQLGIISSCNAKLYLDGELVASTKYHFRDEYGDPRLKKSPLMMLKKGQRHSIKIEAGETYADAQVQLVWAKPQADLHQQALDVAKQADAVVMFMGLTARLEGEEMDVHTDGFNGGDRTKISLPHNQQQLIKDIQALGKPVVLVLLNGSALAVNWANEHVPAILEAWYPGQAAGTAIADILFGDSNPAGRLPVTFYHSVEDLPAFEDYHLTTQTYRFFDKQPLYPFGYGLSYSQFTYSDLVATKTDDEHYRVSVTLTNSGKMDGDEVAQLYVGQAERTGHHPIRSLKGFQRVHLAAGEQQSIEFTLSRNDFALFDQQGQANVVAGDYRVSVGGGQPDQSIEATSNVESLIVSIAQ